MWPFKTTEIKVMRNKVIRVLILIKLYCDEKFKNITFDMLFMTDELTTKLVPTKSHVDDRGFLYQIFQSTDNLFPEIKRIYIVGNFDKAVVRGFHKHLEEWKYFFVAAGSAKFVLVDENNKINNYVLSSKKPHVLVVPPKIYHGWVSLEDNTLLIAISDKTLEESEKDDYRKDPYTFGNVWSVKGR